MTRTPLSARASARLILPLLVLLACDARGTDPVRGRGGQPSADGDAAAEIAARVADYRAALERGDADAAAEYWADDSRLTGPGYDLDRAAVVDGMRGAFSAGTRVEILERRTLEIFAHGDAAYEMARATEVFSAPDGSRADTARSSMFVRWIRGADGRWRFSRALISPLQ